MNDRPFKSFKRFQEYDSVILAVTHVCLEGITFLTQALISRLCGVPRERVTLRHAEFFLVLTTSVLMGLVAVAERAELVWTTLNWLVVGLGNLRILQIIALNLSTLIFDFSPVTDLTESLKKARWHFVAIGFSFFDAVLAFSFMYHFFDKKFEILNQHFSSFFDYLYYSVITMATIGYGDIHPVTPLGRFLAMYEAMVALFFLVFFVSGAMARLHKN